MLNQCDISQHSLGSLVKIVAGVIFDIREGFRVLVVDVLHSLSVDNDLVVIVEVKWNTVLDLANDDFRIFIFWQTSAIVTMVFLSINSRTDMKFVGL